MAVHDLQRGKAVATIAHPDGDETIRLYNPAADLSDASYERADIGYDGDTFVVNTSAGPSGGTARPIDIRQAGISRLKVDGATVTLGAGLAARKVTLAKVNDIVCTAVPRLAETGTITTVAGSALLDTDYFTLDDGVHTYVFEFDSDGIVTDGRRAVPYTGALSANEVRDAVISAINRTAILTTASSGGAATVNLVMDYSTGGGTSSEDVTDAGFGVTGLAAPTGSTAWSYLVVSVMADGTKTAGTATGIADGAATLSAINDNLITWTPNVEADIVSQELYRTVAGGTPGTTGLIATLSATAARYVDAGDAASGSVPTTNTSSVVRATYGALGLAGVTAATTGGLAVADVTGTLVTNYGQTVENTQTLPAAAAGLNAIFVVSTAGAGALHVKAGASDKIYLDGVALDNGDKATLGAPAVGNTLTCLAFQTGAAAWDWICTSGGGATWTDGGA